MTPQIALENLYKAARQLQTNAETHEALKQCFDLVQSVLQSKVEPENT